MSVLAETTVAHRLPLLVTGVAGVAGFNAFHYFRRKYPGQVIGIRPHQTFRLVGEGIVPLDAEDRRAIEAENLAMSEDALRVLGFAYRSTGCEHAGGEIDQDFIWVGLIGMTDPVRRGAIWSFVAFTRRAGPLSFGVRRQTHMGNATWVCFDCREAVRRPTHYSEAVPCPQCGHACRCLGTKIRIPSKGDEREWQHLRVAIRETRLADVERGERMRVRRHRLERQIAELETRPANEGRARTLQQLREKLASL